MPNYGPRRRRPRNRPKHPQPAPPEPLTMLRDTDREIKDAEDPPPPLPAKRYYPPERKV